MRRTYTYVCSAGHLVRAENSQIAIDSLCGACKRAARRRAFAVQPSTGTSRRQPPLMTKSKQGA